MAQPRTKVGRAPLARLQDAANALKNQYGNSVELDGDKIRVSIPDHEHHAVIRTIVQDNSLEVAQNGLNYEITV